MTHWARRYGERPTGSFGDVATSSFYPPHHLTLGEGGAVYTASDELAAILASLRDWGRDCTCPSGVDNRCGRRFAHDLGELPHGYDHKYVFSHFGYNLRATDLQAAVGCAQLERLESFTARRRENHERLAAALAPLADLAVLPRPTPGSRPSWFGFLLTLRDEAVAAGLTRDAIVRRLEAEKIQTRMLFAGNMVRQPCFDGRRASGQRLPCRLGPGQHGPAHERRLLGRRVPRPDRRDARLRRPADHGGGRQAMIRDQGSAVTERGALIGLVVGLFGMAMTVLVLARGGGYFVVVPRLAFVAPLAVVGAVTALAVRSAGRAPFTAVAWLGVIALAGLSWNFFVYSLKFGNAVWSLLLPRARPLGVDFRDGLYDPARAFSTAHSGWPPLTLLLGRPFTLVSFSTGYAVQVGILVALALAAVVLSVRLATRAACSRRSARSGPHGRARRSSGSSWGSGCSLRMASCTRSIAATSTFTRWSSRSSPCG